MYRSLLSTGLHCLPIICVFSHTSVEESVAEKNKSSVSEEEGHYGAILNSVNHMFVKYIVCTIFVAVFSGIIHCKSVISIQW